MISKKSIAALALGATAAIAVPAGVAVGQSSIPSQGIIIQSKGTVKDNGAVAFVKAYVSCPAGEYGYYQADVSERSGSGIAYGYGYDDFTCSGQIQTLTFTVQPQQKPFLPGKAYVTVNGGYTNQQASKTVTLAAAK